MTQAQYWQTRKARENKARQARAEAASRKWAVTFTDGLVKFVWGENEQVVRKAACWQRYNRVDTTWCDKDLVTNVVRVG